MTLVTDNLARRAMRRKTAAALLAASIVLPPAALWAGPALADDAAVPAEVTPAAPVADAPTPTPVAKVRPKAAAAATLDHTGVKYEAGPVAFYVPTTVEVGQPIRISGTGWLNKAGDAGALIALKLDDGAVSTKLEVRHPLTDAVQGNKTVIGMVKASAGGEWQIDLPFPTLTNSDQAWAAGQTHSVRLLTGSSADDASTTNSASFTITKPDASEAEKPPTWSHDTVTTADGATAWIENVVLAGSGSKLRVKGTGFTNTAKSQGSTVAIKLNSGVGKQYTRAADDVVKHPSITADNTIWALLTKSDGTTRNGVYDIDSSGNFEIELDAPAGLTAGQYLTMQVQSGRFLSGDVQRTALSKPLTVGGVAWVDEGGSGAEPTCVPTSAGPTIKIENASVAAGGLLHVTGTGWCHPAANRGGSVVAVKIDEGAYSRLDTSIHQNQTIWTMLQADAATGAIDAQVQIPSGKTTGAHASEPAFTQGSHTLRLLSGSMKVGDTVRTLQSAPFTVGAYSPNGMPEPLEYTEDLASSKRAGLTFTKSSSSIKVTVRGAGSGDWVFLSAYGADGSARYPWGSTWFRANSKGVVTAKLPGVTLPEGKSKLVAQSGNMGEVGKLLGWSYLTVAVTETDTPDKSTKTSAPDAPSVTRPGAVAPGISAAPATSQPPAAVPTGVPAVPAKNSAGLTTENSGGVTGTQAGTLVTVTVASANPGDWVFVYAYSEPTPVGWVQLDADKRLKVDIASLEAGAHKLAIIGPDGKLLGWTSATVATSESTAEPVSPVSAAVANSVAIDSDNLLTETDGWLLAAGVMVLIVASASTLLGRRTRPLAESEKA